MISNLLMLSLNAFLICSVAIPVYETNLPRNEVVLNDIHNDWSDLNISIDSYNSMGYSYFYNTGDFVYYDVSIGGLFLGSHDGDTGFYFLNNGVGTDYTGATADDIADLSVFQNFTWDVCLYYDIADGHCSFIPLYRPFNYDNGNYQCFVSTLEFYLNLEVNNSNAVISTEVTNYTPSYVINGFTGFSTDTWYSYTESFPFYNSMNTDDLHSQSWYSYDIYYTRDDYVDEFTFKLRYIGNITPDYYSMGYNAGYQDGFNAGSNGDSTTAYNNGYSNGYTAGQNYGYTLGYNDGVNTAQGGTFMNLFGAIADTPIMFLRSMFNFDLFGLNVFYIVMSLLTGLLVLYLVKKFWK